MISIKQTGYDLTGLTDILSKQSELSVSLDKFSIDDDLYKIREQMKNPYNKRDKNNLITLEKYLNTLKKIVEKSDNTINLEWKLGKTGISCSPIELLHFKQYGIIATDYLILGDKHLVQVSYKDVYETIAYEMMYRDINNETHRDMENRLSNIGITTVVPSSIILNNLNGDSAIDMSQYMKIGDSPYASEDGKLSWDYFYSVVNDSGAFSTGRYRECVDRSFSITHMILVKETFISLKKQKIQAQLCAINTDGIYIIMNTDDISKLKQLNERLNFESVSIRAFGRKFEVKPKVSVF